MADTDTETTNSSSSRRSSLLKANNNNNNGSSIINNNNSNNNNNISNNSAESGGIEIKTEAASPIFRCEQCNKFETHAHSLLLVHIINCEAKRNGNTGLDGRTTPTTTPTANDSTKKHPLQSQQANGNTMTSTSPADNESVGGGVAGAAAGGAGLASGSSCTNENTENNDDRKQQQQGQPPHSLRKLFECDVCNMKFSNGANMRRHKMRHTGVKPYECRVCQKR